MTDLDVRNIMIWIAAVTPPLALAIYAVMRAGQPAGQPLPRRYARTVIILAAAGPVNLLLWFFHDKWAAYTGPGSVFGYVAAAVVFIVAGFATGFFARLRHRDR